MCTHLEVERGGEGEAQEDAQGGTAQRPDEGDARDGSRRAESVCYVCRF